MDVSLDRWKDRWKDPFCSNWVFLPVIWQITQLSVLKDNMSKCTIKTSATSPSEDKRTSWRRRMGRQGQVTPEPHFTFLPIFPSELTKTTNPASHETLQNVTWGSKIPTMTQLYLYSATGRVHEAKTFGNLSLTLEKAVMQCHFRSDSKACDTLASNCGIFSKCPWKTL